ncbi:hypothetical protein DOTSEDRAFT_69632 [Dothistroma septosporum NZE10]|uniref:Uncharacterized protein n=1 Tax=Dothistroma septosporum (strain NZE10 / CBS 128990) TaxID=675120 RepID=N1PWH3_DOTSN|nr:hypothetical protein DOTSEDRAFT_69632 [Dothistroma septosporum NZE10]
MSQRRNKGRHCLQDDCGSRRFHVGDDGFTYCGQGHQQSELGTIVAEDTGELITRGKTSRKKESDAESVTSKATGFSGARAYEHYLLCVQLVLRKQLRWLIDVQELPQELEILVKDLWALRLQKLQHKVSYDYDTDTEAASSRMVFSSQSEGESGTDAPASIAQRTRTTSRRKPGGPTLTELLCLIHTGIMLLRIPLTIADLHRWVNSHKLLFYRAAKEIPLSMRDRLPGQLQEQLEPQQLIESAALHRGVLTILTAFNADFGMLPPPLNHVLILFRWIKTLCLPLEIYLATQRLARVLCTDFGYMLDAQAWTNMSLRYPEIRLMALVIVTTKLLLPFDDRKRYARSAADLSVLNMDWKLWAESQDHADVPDGDRGRGNALTFAEAFTMTESQSLDLAEDRLAQYLYHFENNIASEEVRERGHAGRDADFRKALFRMFPSQPSHGRPRAQPDIRAHGSSSVDRLVQTQGALHPKRIVADEDSDDVPRAGSAYPHYRAENELGGTTKMFYERASELAGLPLHGMVRAVFFMERRLIRHEKDLRSQRQDKSSMSTKT